MKVRGSVNSSLSAQDPSRLTVIKARYIIPVRPACEVLENHSLIVQAGRIVSLLPSDEALEQFPAGAEVVNLPNHVLIPGLVNMHTHSPMTLLRGYADDLPMQQWLTERIWPAEQQFVGADFVADGTRLAMAEMIRAGTTCFNEMYFYPDTMASAVTEAGMRACIGLPVLEFPTAWARNAGEYLEKGLEILKQDRGDSRVTFSLAPHAPYSVSDETLCRIADISREHDLHVHMHVLETAWDFEQSMQVHGIPPLQRLEQHCLLNSRLLAVHMTQLRDADIRLVAECAVHVLHCPQSNLKLASGHCPVSGLQAAGVNVSIGTDGAASNNNLDLLSEVHTAALLAKGLSGDSRVVDAFSALEMITINGAKALGLEREIGSLEVGKQADVAALDLNAPETQPVHNVISQVIYSASSRQFTDVWVAGHRLMKDGTLTTLDLENILESAEVWRIRMSS